MIKRFRKLILLYKKHPIHLDKRLLIFGVFIIISGFFWLLSSLNKEYNYTINYPISYENVPENKVLSNELPSTVQLKVNAHGYSLVKHILDFESDAIQLDFRTMATLQSSNNNNPSYTIKTADFIHEISQQINSEIRLIYIKPDIITFHFSKLSQKRVPTIANAKIKFADQFQQKGKIKIIPDSIDIIGPQSIIDTIEAVYSKHTPLTDINSKTKELVQFVEIPKTQLSPDEGYIIVDAERFTEQKIKIPIDLINTPTDMRVTLVSQEIEITYVIGLSKFDIIDENSFKATIDYRKLTKDSLPIKLPVTLSKQPTYVTIINYKPMFVNYFIQKR